MSAEADEAAARLADLLRTLDEQVRRLLMRLDTAPGSASLERTTAALVQASRVRTQVLAEIRRRALPGIVTILDEQAVKAARAASRRAGFGEVPIEARRAIREVIGTARDEILATFGEAADAVGVAMRRGTVTAAPLDTAIADVAQVLSTSFVRARAAVDAAVMGASRVVTLEQGAAAEAATGTPMVWVYTGPDDVKTRPFCDQHVRKAYTRAALDRLDNGSGQPKPTSVYLGGYNCRHSLALLPASEARRRGITIVE